MIRRISIITILVVLAVITVVFALKPSHDDEVMLTATAQKGKFESMVYSSGQLESQEADYITVPTVFRDNRLRIWEITIADMIEEGSRVDSGDYVATIDHSAVDEQYKTAMDELDQRFTEYEDSKIDSNLTLSNQRDQIVNAQLDLEERQIIIKESVYEAPSVKRKAEMDLEKAERKYEQMKQAYVLKQQQEANKVDRRFINYKQAKERVDLLQSVYDALTIRSPKSGIIGYYRYSGRGAAVKANSTISTRSPAIATFPKMNTLISTTYINEIDISRIKAGQKVAIGIDAFPEKMLEGEVSSIANVGQLLPRSDAKVFEVKIKVIGDDEELKPSMTTSNVIQTGYAEEAVFVPLESVFTNDSLSYVYLSEKDGRKIQKQVVETGIQNENFVVALQGIKEGDRLLLTEPENAESLTLEGMDIYQSIKDNANQAAGDNSKEAALVQRKQLTSK
ncbi:HlyD family efflux transporter periplasmic adaptor subunit [Maribellus sp. CM-23]|uniref:efflux RND transporter periplasmic adaptor subunit n=1 Tax=Maribellus sp. CM-23 TaxID=2781026 RepID=UPI001F411B39|nr:HlyD family efflux transporter periplasmic adaptor subunit [Maribellus sp. CM-23]MCE4565228.1 HlyD family efflux transporter periplasmic adaptor subunit [Maribellus sp. CM-23]